jgi:hypothetical protein
MKNMYHISYKLINNNIYAYMIFKYIILYKHNHSCKENNFKWALVAIYGPAQIPLRGKFLIELVQMISHER